MSPVVSDISTVSGGELSLPISLAANADHVAQKLKILHQSINALTKITERQLDDVQMCNGVILSAEEQINSAKQVNYWMIHIFIRPLRFLIVMFFFKF